MKLQELAKIVNSLFPHSRSCLFFISTSTQMLRIMGNRTEHNFCLTWMLPQNLVPPLFLYLIFKTKLIFCNFDAQYLFKQMTVERTSIVLFKRFYLIYWFNWFIYFICFLINVSVFVSYPAMLGVNKVCKQ